MAGAENARRAALALPEVTEEPHFDLVSWRVRGKIFATVPPEPDRLRLFLDEVEARELAQANAGAFELLTWGQRVSGVTVDLAVADPAEVAELLEAAWRRRAPKRLVTAYDASRASSG
jgi:hypothetical protein